MQQSAVRIRSLRFVQPVQAPTYAEYAAVHAGAADAAVSLEPMQAEQTAWKNDPTLFAVADRSTPATTPSKGTKISLNTIGGEKWTSVGSTWRGRYRSNKADCMRYGCAPAELFPGLLLYPQPAYRRRNPIPGSRKPAVCV